MHEPLNYSFVKSHYRVCGLQAELEEQEQVVEEEGSDEEEEYIYNPLKLPLGWDGKPIPYWLYKLHGLNQVVYPIFTITVSVQALIRYCHSCAYMNTNSGHNTQISMAQDPCWRFGS